MINKESKLLMPPVMNENTWQNNQKYRSHQRLMVLSLTMSFLSLSPSSHNIDASFIKWEQSWKQRIFMEI